MDYKDQCIVRAREWGHASKGRVITALKEIFATDWPVGTNLVLVFLQKMIGTPYGAIDKCMDKLVDCAELFRIAFWIFLEIDIGSYSDAQYKSTLGTTITTSFADVPSLPPLTLLFYDTSTAKITGHVAGIFDAARIIHSGAAENSAKVDFSKIDWNKSKFICARSFLSTEQLARVTVGGEVVSAPAEAAYWRMLKNAGVPYTNGADIIRVQTWLKELGYFAGSIGGNYGPITEAAVIDFQRHNGLQADGIVGPKTWAALFSDTAKAKPVVRIVYSRKLKDSGKPHLRGDDVRAVQEALRAAGFDPGEIDGVYGPMTVQAVQDFQRARGLTVDGIVGPQTWAALFGA